MTEQSPQAPPSSPARDWWNQVCSSAARDTAARAKLQRSRDRTEAFLVPQALQLARRLKATGPDDPQLGIAMDLARVLAHIRADSREHPMRAVGWASFPRDRGEGQGDERPKLSETRFRRLLQATDGEDRVNAFVRLIALMGAKADVDEIAKAFRWWGSPDSRIKQRWAFQYFNAAQAAPSVVNTASEENDRS